MNIDAYSYINVLDKAADASCNREQCITNNLANVDTPGYKRQDIDFQSVLQQQLGNSKYEDLNKKIKNLDLGKLKASVYTDSANYSYREDKNNVDVDTEGVELASEQLRYTGLTDSMTQEFARLKSVMN